MWWKVKQRIVWSCRQRSRQHCLSSRNRDAGALVVKERVAAWLAKCKDHESIPKVVICSISNREIRPELARPDTVTAPDGHFEVIIVLYRRSSREGDRDTMYLVNDTREMI